MAEGSNDAEDKTEEASPEKREEARKKGQVAASRELTSVFVLASVGAFLSLYTMTVYNDLARLFDHYLTLPARVTVTNDLLINEAARGWRSVLLVILPVFTVTTFVAFGATFLQTRFNWSWEKLKPDFGRLNPLKGIAKIMGSQSLMELGKSIAKMAVVALMAWVILRGEWAVVPSLLRVSVGGSWTHWFSTVGTLIYAVAALLSFVAGADYFYSFMQTEKQLKMTKQEVKEEFKKREVDPQVKAKMKRLQRQYSMAKMAEATKTATVVITNPTHFAVAIKYEFGMRAPVVVAKGADLIALRMRQVAREHKVHTVENKPLARTLFKIVEIGQEVPESLYRAVSEIIKYVFHLKGIRAPKKKKPQAGIS
jgi:flagellar biosynthesis protein FlhB